MKNSTKVLFAALIILMAPAYSLLSLEYYPTRPIEQKGKISQKDLEQRILLTRTRDVNPWHPFRTKAEWQENQDWLRSQKGPNILLPQVPQSEQ